MRIDKKFDYNYLATIRWQLTTGNKILKFDFDEEKTKYLKMSDQLNTLIKI